MKHLQKKRTIQKLWGWICLSVNCLVLTCYMATQREDLLGIGILLSVFTLCYGALKTHLDKLKGDTAIASIVIEYVCVYIITFLAGFQIADVLSSISVLIALTIASLAEILIFLFMTYWRSIRRCFQTKHKG